MSAVLGPLSAFAEATELLRMSMSPQARILIADDRPSSRELLRTVLELAGYAVLEAEDGDEALALARREKPDLILLDLQMPVLDGFGVLAALRSDAAFRDLPVLALTASAMRGDRERILEAGFTDYLAKPAGPELLRETVARLLGKASG